MIELRPYQREGTGAALDFLRNGRVKDRPIIVAPTAAGKSIYIAHIAHQLREGVLVLQPSKELLEQNYAKFRLYGGEASVYSASVGKKEIGSTTFATIGSIKDNPADFAHVKYVLIDECDRVPPKAESMFVSFLNSLPDVKVLGFTATAFRLKKYNDPFSGQPYSQINLLTRERPKFFNKFLHVTQIRELYDGGYLAPIRYIPMAWDAGKLKVNTTGAEFSDDSVDKELGEQMVYERLPGIVAQSIEKGRKHRIVFVKSVEKARQLSFECPDSAFVSAETKRKEREAILTDFKAGKIKTVFNVGVLTVGFDFPALDTVIIARPTMSLSLYMQMVGRGIRTHEGKEDCAVLDMCGNINRFGRIEDIQYVLVNGKWVLRSGYKQLSGVKLKDI